MRWALNTARRPCSKAARPFIGGRPTPIKTASSDMSRSTASTSPTAVARCQRSTTSRIACWSLSVIAPRLLPVLGLEELDVESARHLELRVGRLEAELVADESSELVGLRRVEQRVDAAHDPGRSRFRLWLNLRLRSRRAPGLGGRGLALRDFGGGFPALPGGRHGCLLHSVAGFASCVRRVSSA